MCVWNEKNIRMRKRFMTEWQRRNKSKNANLFSFFWNFLYQLGKWKAVQTFSSPIVGQGIWILGCELLDSYAKYSHHNKKKKDPSQTCNSRHGCVLRWNANYSRLSRNPFYSQKILQEVSSCHMKVQFVRCLCRKNKNKLPCSEVCPVESEDGWKKRLTWVLFLLYRCLSCHVVIASSDGTSQTHRNSLQNLTDWQRLLKDKSGMSFHYMRQLRHLGSPDKTGTWQRSMGGQLYRKIEADRHSDRHTDWLTDGQTDKQANRQTLLSLEVFEVLFHDEDYEVQITDMWQVTDIWIDKQTDRYK